MIQMNRQFQVYSYHNLLIFNFIGLLVFILYVAYSIIYLEKHSNHILIIFYGRILCSITMMFIGTSSFTLSQNISIIELIYGLFQLLSIIFVFVKVNKGFFSFILIIKYCFEILLAQKMLSFPILANLDLDENEFNDIETYFSPISIDYSFHSNVNYPNKLISDKVFEFDKIPNDWTYDWLLKNSYGKNSNDSNI